MGHGDTHKMVFSLPSKAAIEKDLPSKATLEADAGKVYLLAQHVQGLTHTSTPAECQASRTPRSRRLGFARIGDLRQRSCDVWRQEVPHRLFIAACLSRGLSTSLSWDTNL